MGDYGDPSFVAVLGAYTATINSYLRTELKFDSDLPYHLLADVEPWKLDVENRYLDTSTGLARAMSENPRLKVWITCGYYDLAVSYFSTQYTIGHMRLQPAIRQNLTLSKFDSGHMIYNDQIAMKALRQGFHQLPAHRRPGKVAVGCAALFARGTHGRSPAVRIRRAVSPRCITSKSLSAEGL